MGRRKADDALFRCPLGVPVSDDEDDEEGNDPMRRRETGDAFFRCPLGVPVSDGEDDEEENENDPMGRRETDQDPVANKETPKSCLKPSGIISVLEDLIFQRYFPQA